MLATVVWCTWPSESAETEKKSLCNHGTAPGMCRGVTFFFQSQLLPSSSPSLSIIEQPNPSLGAATCQSDTVSELLLGTAALQPGEQRAEGGNCYRSWWFKKKQQTKTDLFLRLTRTCLGTPWVKWKSISSWLQSWLASYWLLCWLCYATSPAGWPAHCPSVDLADFKRIFVPTCRKNCCWKQHRRG